MGDLIKLLVTLQSYYLYQELPNTLEQIIPFSGHVMRVPFLNVDHFAHRSRDTVKEEFDVALKRNVIAVKSQRVPLHLVHVFSNVIPGEVI